MSFIVVEHGAPYSLDALSEPSFNRLGVIRRAWDELVAFDQTTEYQLQIDSVPQYGSFSRFLARTIYNPKVYVDCDWRPVGPYEPTKLIARVEAGLEFDDDVIQQWFEADQVLQLLRSSHDFQEMTLAVRAICGEHERDSAVLSFVKRALGESAA